MKYLQKFRLNHPLPLEKFFIRVGGGWLMKSVCFCCSEPALDAAREWASRRGWRFLLSEREKKHAAHSLPEWAHFSAPYSSHWWQRRAPSPHWAACVAYSKRSSKKQMEKHRKGWAQCVISAVCSLNLKVTERLRLPWLCRLEDVHDGPSQVLEGTKVQLSFAFRKQALFLVLTALVVPVTAEAVVFPTTPSMFLFSLPIFVFWCIRTPTIKVKDPFTDPSHVLILWITYSMF